MTRAIPTHELEDSGPAGAAFFYGLAAFVMLAPLYKGGNRALPLLLLELGAIGLLFVAVAVKRAPLALPRTLVAAIALLLAWPLLQIVPLPPVLWRQLPGHEQYVAVVDRFAAPGAAALWRAISVAPSATEAGWLALLPPLACLLGVLRLSRSHVEWLLLALVALAGAQALLGLLQIQPAGGGFFYFGNEEPGQYVAIGTFVNKNHLAAMLAMTLPVAVGLLVNSIRSMPQRRRRQLTSVTAEAIARRALLFATAALILLCLVFTRSRAGIASGAVGLLCAGALLVRARAAGPSTTAAPTASHVVTALIAVSIVAAAAIGIGPLLAGLDPRQIQEGAGYRWGLYGASWRAALEFLPLGSGLSTFADAFARFEREPGYTIDYAHNDYLQALLELGLAAPVIVALAFAAYATRLRGLLRTAGTSRFALLQIGAGVGLLPMILHSGFDFALHMPANAMWFATLAGVLFHPGTGPRDPVVDMLRRPVASARFGQPPPTPTPVTEGPLAP